MTDTTYRTSHLGSQKAETYNDDYDNSFLGHFWREVERPQLLDLFQEVFPEGLDSSHHLDVACGTGRVLATVSELTERSEGVDISPDMLHFAELNAPKTRLRVGDVTKLGELETYDLVTAFRFFLNAEQPLRDGALESIVAAMKPGAILITNIHASPWSIIGLFRRVSRAMGRVADNTMHQNEFAEFLSAAGLELVSSRTYGFVPLSTKIPSSLMSPLCALDTRLASAMPNPSRFASDWLVAVRKPA
jgi:predicted TPR repeat methyltransferase